MQAPDYYENSTGNGFGKPSFSFTLYILVDQYPHSVDLNRCFDYILPEGKAPPLFLLGKHSKHHFPQ